MWYGSPKSLEVDNWKKILQCRLDSTGADQANTAFLILGHFAQITIGNLNLIL